MSPRECAKKQSHRPDLADQRSGQAKREVSLGKSASHCWKAKRLGVVYSNESVKEADDNRHRRRPGKSHSPQETLSLLVVFHLLRSFPPLPRRHPLRLPLALLLRRRARQELRPPHFPHRILPAPRHLHRHLRHRIHNPVKILLPHRRNLRIRRRIQQVNGIRPPPPPRKFHRIQLVPQIHIFEKTPLCTATPPQKRHLK